MTSQNLVYSAKDWRKTTSKSWNEKPGTSYMSTRTTWMLNRQNNCLNQEMNVWPADASEPLQVGKVAKAAQPSSGRKVSSFQTFLKMIMWITAFSNCKICKSYHLKSASYACAAPTIESLSSTSNTNTDTDVFTSVLILVPGILKR
jgi:hypothetical protein